MDRFGTSQNRHAHMLGEKVSSRIFQFLVREHNFERQTEALMMPDTLERWRVVLFHSPFAKRLIQDVMHTHDSYGTPSTGVHSKKNHTRKIVKQQCDVPERGEGAEEGEKQREKSLILCHESWCAYFSHAEMIFRSFAHIHALSLSATIYSHDKAITNHNHQCHIQTLTYSSSYANSTTYFKFILYF